MINKEEKKSLLCFFLVKKNEKEWKETRHENATQQTYLKSVMFLPKRSMK